MQVSFQKQGCFKWEVAARSKHLWRCVLAFMGEGEGLVEC